MAIKPIYSQENLQTGEIEWLLYPEDFEKIRQGYGCPKCLEDYNGLCLATCPVCNHTRDALKDFTAVVPDHMKPGRAGPAPEPSLF